MNMTNAEYLDEAARQKNGLNFQIFVGGALVCLSALPLILAFSYPILSVKAFSLFLLGAVLAYGGWPMHCFGLEGRKRLLADLHARGLSYGDVEKRSWFVMPDIGRRLLTPPAAH